MTIDEAIKVLEIFRDEGEVDLPPNVDPALTLGIEALKAIEVYRSANESWLSLPLPGETK